MILKLTLFSGHFYQVWVVQVVTAPEVVIYQLTSSIYLYKYNLRVLYYYL